MKFSSHIWCPQNLWTDAYHTHGLTARLSSYRSSLEEIYKNLNSDLSITLGFSHIQRLLAVLEHALISVSDRVYFLALQMHSQNSMLYHTPGRAATASSSALWRKKSMENFYPSPCGCRTRLQGPDVSVPIFPVMMIECTGFAMTLGCPCTRKSINKLIANSIVKH